MHAYVVAHLHLCDVLCHKQWLGRCVPSRALMSRKRPTEGASPPSPSCPWLSDPEAQTLPLAVRHSVCASPAATCCTASGRRASCGSCTARSQTLVICWSGCTHGAVHKRHFQTGRQAPVRALG